MGRQRQELHIMIDLIEFHLSEVTLDTKCYLYQDI